MSVLGMVGQVLDACAEVDRLRQVVAERDAEIARLKAERDALIERDRLHVDAADMYYSLYCDEVKRGRGRL